MYKKIFSTLSCFLCTVLIISGCGNTIRERGINDTDPPRTPDTITTSTKTNPSTSLSNQTCFQNIGLKETATIQFVFSNEDTFSGTFITSDSIDDPKIYPFTGKKNESNFEVNFQKTLVPKMLGEKQKFTWELINENSSLVTNNNSVLEVPIYGQDYATQKYSYYKVKFVVCNSN